MDWIWLSFIYALALAMDCFALSVTDGLVYQKLGKWKPFFIAGIFGLFQGLFPLIGSFLGDALIQFIDKFDHWVAFGLLLLIGGKMLFEGIKGTVKPEEKKEKEFRYRDILLQGIADSIDALAIGLTLYENVRLVGTPVGYEKYVICGIIAVVSFGISLVGIYGGKFINKLLKGRYEISEIIGGSVLIVLGVILVLEGCGVISF